jgi:hypothetical protein
MSLSICTAFPQHRPKLTAVRAVSGRAFLLRCTTTGLTLRLLFGIDFFTGKRSGREDMGSFQPPVGSFQSEELAVLQKVFDDVWSTIETHRPTQAQNDELKTMVSETLCAIAASGVMDAEQLRSKTLANFELSRPPE